MTCLFWEPGKKANCVHSTINPNRLLFFLVLTIFCCFLQLYHWHYAKVNNFISLLLLAQDQRQQSWVGKIGSSCPLRLPIRTQDSLHIAHMHCQQYDKCIHWISFGDGILSCLHIYLAFVSLQTPLFSYTPYPGVFVAGNAHILSAVHKQHASPLSFCHHSPWRPKIFKSYNIK